MSILKTYDLPSAWTDFSVMIRDNQGADKGDGVLTRTELKTHLDGLSAERVRTIADGGTTGYVDMQIDTGRKLYADMVAADADGVQYLDDELMVLPKPLRKRAVEVLDRDDITFLGVIDQFALDHARGRYHAMTALTSEMIVSKEKALAELDQLAIALGLE